MLKPKRDGTVESPPSAKCAEGWPTRRLRMMVGDDGRNREQESERKNAMSRYWRVLAAAISLLTSAYGHGAGHALVPRFAYVANNQDDTVSIFAIRGYRLQAVGHLC